MCFPITGLVTTLAGSMGVNLYFPAGVAVDSMGTVYVADWANSRIRKVTSAGERSGRWTWTKCLVLVLSVVVLPSVVRAYMHVLMVFCRIMIMVFIETCSIQFMFCALLLQAL